MTRLQEMKLIAEGAERNRLDAQSKLNEALAREAALREELESIKASVDGYDSPEHAAQVADEMGHQCISLQQRLTVAEQRLSQVEGACDLAMSAIDDDERGANFVKIIQAIKDKAALPWAYTLDCGHEFYGQKSRPKPLSGAGYPKHPKIMRCRECYP